MYEQMISEDLVAEIETDRNRLQATPKVPSNLGIPQDLTQTLKSEMKSPKIKRNVLLAMSLLTFR